jgi:hypothetical protein
MTSSYLQTVDTVWISDTWSRTKSTKLNRQKYKWKKDRGKIRSSDRRDLRKENEIFSN